MDIAGKENIDLFAIPKNSGTPCAKVFLSCDTTKVFLGLQLRQRLFTERVGVYLVHRISLEFYW